MIQGGESEYYLNHQDYLANAYQVEKDYRDMQLWAVGILTGPLALESGAATYLFFGTKTTVAARISVAGLDALYQLGKTGKWNPIQTLSSQFGPLTYALGSSTTFDWGAAKRFDNPIGVAKDITLRKIVISTVFNALGTKFVGMAEKGGFAPAGGPVNQIPTIWGDGANEIIDGDKKQ